VVVLNIALMNEKVIFQKCSVVKDGIGNHRNEWTEDYCCFATIGGEGLASSREAETAGTVVEDVGMIVTVRYCKKTAGIRSVTHRILFRDQVYDIVSVDHLNYKKKCLKFTCRKVRR
jgi:SPP1 family predicted phage head-tail adaptor